MTQEEKLQLAKEWYNDPSVTEEVKAHLEELFPELKESEDERIRNEIIAFVEQSIHRGGGTPIPQEQEIKWIAWLEKQGSIGKINEKLRQYREYLVKETERWHKKEEDETLSKIGKQDCIGHANAYISARSKFEDLFNYDSWSEKQGNVYPTEDELEALRIAAYEPTKNWSEKLQSLYEKLARCEQVEQTSTDENVEPKFKVGDTIRPKGSMAEYTIESISGECYHGKGWGLHISCDDDYELVEQKHTDKVEPKFHAGDFITDGERIFQIKETIWERNNRNDGTTYCESLIVNLRDGNTYANNTDLKEYHLWTIQDAKDGDILADGDTIIIFRNIGNCKWDDVIDFYVGYNQPLGRFCIQSGILHYGNADTVTFKPATKEQRDLLLDKIVDAGYIWDPEKKMLTKIEDDPVPIPERRINHD